MAVCSSKRQPILSFVPTIDQEFPHDRIFRGQKCSRHIYIYIYIYLESQSMKEK